MALITPFTSDGNVDYKSLTRLVEYQIDNGADFLCILATTSEAPCLSAEEKEKVKQLVIEVNRGRLPLLMGCGGNNTKAIVEELKNSDWRGIDGVLSVCPYYNKPSQEGLYQHFKAIAEASPLPVVLYNVPGRTGVNLKAETTVRLANDCENIIAIKEASGNIGYTAKVAAKCGDKIDIYSGNDDMIVPIMSLGGKGVISVLSNVLPKETHQMTQYCLENNFAAASELQLKYLRLINDLFMEVNPIPVKEAMNQLGMPSGPCRMPLLDMSDEHKAAMQATLRAYGMLS
mgnify:CR=1 FL=1